MNHMLIKVAVRNWDPSEESMEAYLDLMAVSFRCILHQVTSGLHPCAQVVNMAEEILKGVKP